MNGNRLHGRCAASLVIVASLLFLSGCQGLGGGSNNAGQIGIGNGSLNFGAVAVGSTKTLPNTITNNTSTAIFVSSIQGLTPSFQLTGVTLPMAVAIGQTVSFNVVFQPTAPGSASVTTSFYGQDGTLYTSMGASGDAVNAGTLALNPTQLAFGNIPVGSPQTSSVTLSNSGGDDLSVSAATLSGAGFSLSNLALPLTLHAGDTTSATVTFAPTGSGNFSGSVTFTTTSDQVDGSVVLNLSGTGVAVSQGILSLNPSSLAFGNVQVGGTSSLSETLTNTGGTAVTISQASASGAGFSISGLTLPATVAANQSVSFQATFAPTTSGAATGAVSIVSNASNSPLSLPLSGAGVTPGVLASNPTSFSFGNVQDGTSKALSGTLTNSGGTSVTISAAAATGTGFSLTGLSLPLTLTAGQSTPFTVLFSPSASGVASGNVTITSNGSNPSLSIPLSGIGVTQGALAADPVSLAFGSVQVGNSTALPETLTNSGGTSVTISAATATGSGFSLSGLSLPLTLTAGQSTSFTVTFAPTASGAASGNVTITSNGANPSLSIPLSGTGVTAGGLAANPTSLAFGKVLVGGNKSVSDTLTNTGGTSLTITAAAATGAGFSLSGLSLPLTLNAGQSTTFTVTFAPTASGSISGNVTITSNGSNPSLSIPLTGTGITPGTLSANPTSLAFGSVQIGGNSSLSETLTNSGGSSLTISAAAVTGAGFSLSGLSLPLTLNAGQSTSFTVTFAPTASGAASGNVSITSDGSNPTLSIALTGTGVTPGALSANPTSLGFGSVQVGNHTNLSETLTNTGGSPVTITAANLSGAAFSISGLTLPLTLTSTQSVTFTATFTPTSAGAASGSLSVVSNASNSPLSITLSGTGTAAGTLAVSPTSLSFGNVTVGSSSALNGTLTASGASVTIASESLNNAEFVLSGISLPVTLTAGQSTPAFTVTFTPQASGATSASLSFTSNASNSPTTQTMTGTGTVQHTVDLTWNASTGAVSYNTYRKLSTDVNYTMIGSSPTTSYTDNTVASGDTYDYAVTAVDGSGESPYSNIATAIIP